MSNRHLGITFFVLMMLLVSVLVSCAQDPGDYVVYRVCLSDDEANEQPNTRYGTATFILYTGMEQEADLLEGNQTTGSDGVATVTSAGETDFACVESGVASRSDVDFTIFDNEETTLVTDAPGGAGIEGAAGDVAFVTLGLVDDFPAAQPGHYYQYGFVFDTDGDPANDYEPAPAYPADFFGGTNRWYQLNGEPGAGWDLSVQDIVNGQPVTADSDATVLSFGNGLVLLAPVDELGNPADVGWRGSAFLHDGNWLADDWNADVDPAVGEALRTLIP